MVRASGALKKWVLCIDEAHRFKDDPYLRVLLNKSRKFTRKLIAVMGDVESFKGIAKVFKPYASNQRNHETNITHNSIGSRPGPSFG